jgi:inner membrane protein
MDPLTHTLVGANLSATRLGEKTRFAAAALVIGANLPDIDGICYMIDSDLALAFRRGWTHGVLALALLPLLQSGIFAALDRVWRREGARVRFGWMLLLSVIAIWSHPTLDWLNTYGLRWLMPFDGRWFYGDSVYIMDPWLWLLLGIGYLAGRRPTTPIVVAALLIGGWIVRTVARRSPDYLPLLATVAVILIAALLWKRPVVQPALGRRFATVALIASIAYIGVRIGMNEATESAVAADFASRGTPVTRMMAGPDPITPLKWSIVAQTGELYRYGTFNWRDRTLVLHEQTAPVARDSEEWSRAKRDPRVRGLVTWMRFPAYEIERRGSETHVHLWDARRSGAARRQTVVLR